MKRSAIRLLITVALPMLGLAIALVVLAGEAATKPFAEGQAGTNALAAPAPMDLARTAEGHTATDGASAQAGAEQRGYAEGKGGRTGVVDDPQKERPVAPEAPTALSVKLQFSGVTDDGKKSAADRKEATSILCTNAGTSVAEINVELFQWNGALVYTATVTANPKASFTFSTQNTTIYFDDVIFGTGGGTDSIFQGFGRVLSDRAGIVCSAEVLDPLGYPPVFVSGLEMVRP